MKLGTAMLFISTFGGSGKLGTELEFILLLLGVDGKLGTPFWFVGGSGKMENAVLCVGVSGKTGEIDWFIEGLGAEWMD